MNCGEHHVYQQENFSEYWLTRRLPSVNRPVNARKRAFSGVCSTGKLPDNGTNAGIHRPENIWKTLDFPVCEQQKMLEMPRFM